MSNKHSLFVLADMAVDSFQLFNHADENDFAVRTFRRVLYNTAQMLIEQENSQEKINSLAENTDMLLQSSHIPDFYKPQSNYTPTLVIHESNKLESSNIDTKKVTVSSPVNTITHFTHEANIEDSIDAEDLSDCGPLETEDEE